MSLNSHDVWSLKKSIRSSRQPPLVMSKLQDRDNSRYSKDFTPNGLFRATSSFWNTHTKKNTWLKGLKGWSCMPSSWQTQAQPSLHLAAAQLIKLPGTTFFLIFFLSKYAFGTTNFREFRHRIVIFCQVAQKIWTTMSLHPSEIPSRFGLFLPFSSEFDISTWEDIPFGGSRLFSVNTQTNKMVTILHSGVFLREWDLWVRQNTDARERGKGKKKAFCF